MDLKLDLAILPVSDVDRSKAFYEKVGFRLDLDTNVSDQWRAVHLTPPGSECAILLGKGFSAAAPGSSQSLYLVVSDIEAARDENSWDAGST